MKHNRLPVRGSPIILNTSGQQSYIGSSHRVRISPYKVSEFFIQFIPDLNSFRHLLVKPTYITLHRNPSSKNRNVLCGWTDMKLRFAFRKFAKAPEKYLGCTDVSKGSKRLIEKAITMRRHGRKQQKIG